VVTTTRLDRAADTEILNSIVPETCSPGRGGGEATVVRGERSLPAGRPAPTWSRRFPDGVDSITLSDGDAEAALPPVVLHGLLGSSDGSGPTRCI